MTINEESIGYPPSEARSYRYAAAADDIRLTVPAVDEMMSICETNVLRPGFFKLAASKCQRLCPFMDESTPIYFIWLPQESNEGLSYLAEHGPGIGNCFINSGTLCQTHLLWSRKDGGDVAMHSEYLELNFGIENSTQVFLFSNGNRIVSSIEYFDQDFLADLFNRIMSCKDYYPEQWESEEHDSSTIYLHGTKFFSTKNRSSTTHISEWEDWM